MLVLSVVAPTASVADTGPEVVVASTRTVEVNITGYTATWIPGQVSLTVHLAGNVSQEGQGVSDANVSGRVNVTTGDPCWGPVGCPQMVTERSRTWDATTDAEGNYTADVGPYRYSSTFVPPTTLFGPYCEWVETDAVARNASASDDDHDISTVCTQTIP